MTQQPRCAACGHIEAHAYHDPTARVHREDLHEFLLAVTCKSCGATLAQRDAWEEIDTLALRVIGYLCEPCSKHQGGAAMAVAVPA